MYGQWWRFYTTTLLHANLLHLMVSFCLLSLCSFALWPIAFRLGHLTFVLLLDQMS